MPTSTTRTPPPTPRHRPLLLTAALAALVPTLAPATALSQDAASFRREWTVQFESSARKLIMLAEAMPAESYSWQPMEGVATVASAYMHIARYNYLLPHRNLGIEPPSGVEYQTFEEAITEKDDVLRVLRASMLHVREAVAGMGDADLSADVNLYGRDVPAWGVLLQLVTHMNEHLGQQIAYARSNRVVPPWSG